MKTSAVRFFKILAFVLYIPVAASAQAAHAIPVDSLNLLRIKTNETGMKVLVTWSAANIVTGVAGCLISGDKESKSFYGMNAIWGVTNLGISGMGLLGARKELQKKYNAGDALQRYEANKRLFLINAGLDAVYIGGGALLLSYAGHQTDPETCRGFGKSVMLQGVFLLIFDGTMYSLHQRQNSKWLRAMQHIGISSNGVGFRYIIQ